MSATDNTVSKLDAARSTFKANPNRDTAAMYFSCAREAEECGDIDDDVWCNDCAAIEHWLWTGDAE